MEQFIQFLNSQFGTAIGSIITIGCFLVYIVSRTKWGKNAIKTLTASCNKLAIKYEEKVGEVAKLKQEMIEKDKKYEAELKEYRDIVLKVCETVPNKKVHELGLQIANKISDEELAEKQAELAKLVKDHDNKTNALLNEINTYYNNLKSKYKLLEKDVFDTLNQKIEHLKTVAVEDYLPLYEEIKAEVEKWQKRN